MAPAQKRSARTMEEEPKQCKHESLMMYTSCAALEAGYRQSTNAQILAALKGNSRSADDMFTSAELNIFPAPLGLPGDDITYDPKYSRQTMQSWLGLPERNPATTRRKTIYVAAPPTIDASVRFMKDWSRPWCRHRSTAKRSLETRSVRSFDTNTVIAYVKAFYYPLEVKVLSVPLSFMAWDEPVEEPDPVSYVGLSTGEELCRIQARCVSSRNTPEDDGRFPYRYQLDLNDLTDVALTLLPPDAFALLMMTEHDMYESQNDDFCCGRAWGSSRVAIVSSARYQPNLDAAQGVDRNHMWPASHCASFVEAMVSKEKGGGASAANARNRTMKRRKASPPAEGPSFAERSPLKSALRAAQQHSSAPLASDLESMFLFRLCRTASHELGHCFGLDHCMYKACAMQSTSSVAEDMRQPPYLCPVCEAKVAWAVLQRPSNRKGRQKMAAGATAAVQWETRMREWKRERLLVMKQFCQHRGSAFSALAAWSDALLDLMDGARIVENGFTS